MAIALPSIKGDFSRPCSYVAGVPLSHIKETGPQKIVDSLRKAWSVKQPVPFLLAYVKLIRLSLEAEGSPFCQITINEDLHLSEIWSAMHNGSGNPPFMRGEYFFQSNYLPFRSGTAGERWYFSRDQENPALRYMPGENNRISVQFQKQLSGCQGIEIVPGDRQFITIKLSV